MVHKDQEIKQCAVYFKERPVYEKLFQKFRKKYESLGHFGGTVVLSGLTGEEKNQLGGFLQKDYTEHTKISVSASLMEKALASSRFSDLSWEEILETYFGEKLTVKKEAKRQQEKKKEAFFSDILNNSPDGPGKSWFIRVLKEREEGFFWMMQQYRERPGELAGIVKNVLTAIPLLPVFSEGKEKMLLAVFAAEVTGNPHYFDEGSRGEALLFAFIKSYLNMEVKEGLSRAEYKKKLFFEAGILKDELSSDVLAYGIRAVRKDGSVHPGVEGFFRCREPVKLTLKTLGNIDRISSGKEENGNGPGKVYVVENPAVFSALTQKYPDRALICGNGQLKLAVLLLMDKLKDNSEFYYAGDFDPEGLMIAQKLKIRYGERLNLWNYKGELYRKYLSDVVLDNTRIKKLDKITIPELQEVKEAMIKKIRAAYQESMLEEYQKNIEGNNELL